MKTKSRNNLWLLAAFAAPAAHFSGGGWLAAALTALAVLPLSLLPRRWVGMAKPVALAEAVWLGIVAGSLLANSAAYWPSDNDLAVPLTILTLAALTNAAAAPGTGAVVAFCMGLLALPAAVAGVSGLEFRWLRPAMPVWSGGLALAMLLPALPCSASEGKGRGLLTAGVLAVLLSALVQGVVAPEVAISLPDPFYQTARTLGHLEPVVAAGMTLGWYALTTLLLKSGSSIAENAGFRRRTASVLPVGTATASVLFLQQPNAWFVTITSAFFWVLIPFLHKMKLFQKSEK